MKCYSVIDVRKSLDLTIVPLRTIVGLRVAGTLKNHFIDRNDVLRKMLGLGPRRPQATT
jgi:cytochrome b561